MTKKLKLKCKCVQLTTEGCRDLTFWLRESPSLRPLLGDFTVRLARGDELVDLAVGTRRIQYCKNSNTTVRQMLIH